jgi:acetyltransferase-like isoleucine patch superfamily enzyme
VTIVPGVKIGNGVTIGASSVVTKVRLWQQAKIGLVAD